jgi:hypothetical protein
MESEKCAVWNSEGLKFFKSVPDGSVDLILLISFGCASQTGVGFRELINSINSDDIKKKLKEVHIIDTCCLYRWTTKGFAQYTDSSIPTRWFLNNEESIKKLKVKYSFKSWADDIKTAEFEKHYEQVKIYYWGDKSGKGVVPEFRKLVEITARENEVKSNGTFDENVEFILEECAYADTFFNNQIIVYPASLNPPMEFSMASNNVKCTMLGYRLSWSTKNHMKQGFLVFFFLIDRYMYIARKRDSCGFQTEKETQTPEPKSPTKTKTVSLDEEICNDQKAYVCCFCVCIAFAFLLILFCIL